MYSNELVKDILDYIDNNLYSEINIDLISGYFCYDKFYIMKKFKKEISLSIINYVNSMRIFYCLDYFDSNNSFLNIAINNGFKSLEYFSEIFKSIMGVSPRKYKMMINNDIRLSAKDRQTIIDSVIRLRNLKKYCDTYKQRVKPRENMVKKLSIFK